MGRLTDKYTLITGGTSGIGLATAQAFIAEGARVAVTGRNRTPSPKLSAFWAIRPGDPDRRRRYRLAKALAETLAARWPRLDAVFSTPAT